MTQVRRRSKKPGTAEYRARQEAAQYVKDAWQAAHPDYDPDLGRARQKAAFRKMAEAINCRDLNVLPQGTPLPGAFPFRLKIRRAHSTMKHKRKTRWGGCCTPQR